VGLCKWRDLIASANRNVTQIATRDGVVLTNPFNRFADSWRVSGDESMLSVCNAEGEIERGAS
jgi:hypothetical protein